MTKWRSIFTNLRDVDDPDLAITAGEQHRRESELMHRMIEAQQTHMMNMANTNIYGGGAGGLAGYGNMGNTFATANACNPAPMRPAQTMTPAFNLQVVKRINGEGRYVWWVCVGMDMATIYELGPYDEMPSLPDALKLAAVDMITDDKHKLAERFRKYT